MKWPFRHVAIVTLGTLLLPFGTLWAQSGSRGSSTGPMEVLPSIVEQPYQVQPYQAQPYEVQPYQAQPAQPNTFVPYGTEAVAPGSIVTNPGTAVAAPQSVMNSSPAVETFEQKFWSYLLRARYRNWAPVPGKSDKMYEGESPHGAYLKMYLNRTAAGSPSDLPSGSIVIKENYGPDQRTLMAVTVMYKNKGYSKSTGDWYWVKYNPDGSVAMKETDAGSKRLAGRVQGCIQCHDGAEGGDFAFFND